MLALKKIIDPLIYPHVKILNDMGVKTEFSCAGTGKSYVCIDGKISQRRHGSGGNITPYIITSDKLNHNSKIILGLISILSPELYYCEKDKKLFSGCLKNKCKCPKDVALISSCHQGFKLIDVYSTHYNRKIIGIDRNMEMLLRHNNEDEGKKKLPLIRKLFFIHFLKILKYIKKYHLIVK